eukprot:COSAG06_NODE_3673_length_5030_cov_6.804097_1_plen_106_part_00
MHYGRDDRRRQQEEDDSTATTSGTTSADGGDDDDHDCTVMGDAALVVPRGDINWPEFLAGWANVRHDERASKILNVDQLAPKHTWRLISLLVDTPISKEREVRLI